MSRSSVSVFNRPSSSVVPRAMGAHSLIWRISRMTVTPCAADPLAVSITCVVIMSLWLRQCAHYRATPRVPFARRLVREEEFAGFPRPPLFPRGPRRFARAAPKAIEQLLLVRIRLEQIEQHVGELDRGRKQQAVIAVTDPLGEAGAVVECADRHT